MSQMDFIANASTLRDMGMQQAEDNANRKVDGWSEIAMSHLKAFLSERGPLPFMAEDVRLFALKGGLEQPPSERAWGGIMTKAFCKGLIKKVGLGPTSNPSAHKANATIWQRDQL